MSKKYDRHIELLNSLRNGERYIYKNLARTFTVSVKTIKQDISELSLYFPIETYTGRNGGVSMNKSFLLNGYIMKNHYIELIIKGLKLLRQNLDDLEIDTLISYFNLNSNFDG